MVDVTKIDHVEQGLSLLPSQWDNATNIRSVLESWLTPMNVTEDDLELLRTGFNINTAIGYQLDIIGNYFKLTRDGRTDTEYRNAILAFIIGGSGSGTTNELLDLLASISQSSGGSRNFPHYPLSFYMTTDVDTDLSFPNLIQEAAVAGVELIGVGFNPNGIGWIPKDKVSAQDLLVDNDGDNIVDNVGDNIEVTTFSEEQDDGFGNSSFIDESQDQPSGYGLNYGNAYGGVPFGASALVDMATVDNTLGSASSDFLPWATTAEIDSETGTTNKVAPILQMENSGLKRREPLPRQIFNYLMGTISDWLSYRNDRFDVGYMWKSTDIGLTAGDLDTAIGGTWTSRGTEVIATVNVYIFERTA